MKITSYYKFIILYFPFIFCSLEILGQNINRYKYVEVYVEKTKSSDRKDIKKPIGEIVSIILDYTNKEFKINKSWVGYDYTSTEIIMKGTFIMHKNKIRCRNPIENKDYLLQIIDADRLKNTNLPYIGDTLYIESIIKEGHRQFFGNWRNGKKNGVWIYYKNGKMYQKKIFRDNILIKTEDL